jgi:hypothetical protein
MDCYICRTCGVQHAPSEVPPARCTICDDERQYVGWDGQRWTTIEALRAEGRTVELRDLEDGLTGLCVTPRFAIGQRALLVRTPAGNVLWDGQSYLDDDTVRAVGELGGIAAICLSHPHFHGAMVEWSEAFGGAPIHVPRADASWVMRPHPSVRLWDGDRLDVLPGVTMVRCGGHFEGSSVLHWAAGAGGAGALLVGDTVAVVPDRRYVSFMRSYPNLIPLPPAAVRRIVTLLDPLPYDRIYGGWWDREVRSDAKRAVSRSADRYIARVHGDLGPDTPDG